MNVFGVICVAYDMKFSICEIIFFVNNGEWRINILILNRTYLIAWTLVTWTSLIHQCGGFCDGKAVFFFFLVGRNYIHNTLLNSILLS